MAAWHTDERGNEAQNGNAVTRSLLLPGNQEVIFIVIVLVLLRMILVLLLIPVVAENDMKDSNGDDRLLTL